ncbi:MAG: hypothetical protein WC792_01840 [Candidatus Micrarchaeia archaeon]
MPRGRSDLLEFTCNECSHSGGGTFCRKFNKHLELGQAACSHITPF